MLDFLYIAVSWVLLRWHQFLTFIGMPSAGGWTWVLSIVLLVITARLLLFRLFVKQVHYQRNMQKMQPKIQKLREKYKNDRAELNRQMMAMQQEEGFNPLAGCLPMFLQFPVFIGLYHTLRHIADSNVLCHNNGTGKSSNLTLYTFTARDTCSAAQAKIFNSPLAATFHDPSSFIRQLGGNPTDTRILLVILLIISASATFSTQLLVRRNATTVAEGTSATIQKAMLYLIPIGTLVSGLFFKFPLGVLMYWFTSNLWTLGQQAYIIKFHPPTDDEVAAPTGSLGKTLAPRPGQRPVRLDKSKQAANGSAPGMMSSTEDAVSVASAEGESSTRSSTPRPGQRPNRPTGKRPPAKRPTQAKKRR